MKALLIIHKYFVSSKGFDKRILIGKSREDIEIQAKAIAYDLIGLCQEVSYTLIWPEDVRDLLSEKS